MNRPPILEAAVCFGLALLFAGCERKVTAQQTADPVAGPAPTTVQADMDPTNFQVDHPERFPLATAGVHVAAPDLNATGVVSPDVSRQAPVPSLATALPHALYGR